MDKIKAQLHYSNGESYFCSICPLPKQRRLSFVSSNHLSKCAFDLVHCNTWGPYHIPTYVEHRYFLTLVDDYTRFTWVFLMRHKSKARNIVPKFFSLVETQFNKVIKKFRSNNAPKLQFIEYFAFEGVIHQLLLRDLNKTQLLKESTNTF